MSDQAFTLPEIEFPDPMGIRLAALYLDVSEMRVGALVREGRIPGTKDDQGRWLLTKEALDTYTATKGQGGGGGPRGDGKMWKVRVKHEDFQKLNALLKKDFGTELVAAYNYEKQKEYRQRAAKKAAAEKKATKAAAAAE